MAILLPQGFPQFCFFSYNPSCGFLKDHFHLNLNSQKKTAGKINLNSYLHALNIPKSFPKFSGGMKVGNYFRDSLV